MFYTCVYSCNYCSALSMSTCVCFSTGISILCNSTKGVVGRKCGQCRLAPLYSSVPFLLVFSVWIWGFTFKCVQCVCLWRHAVDQAPQLFDHSLYQLLFVSLILPELKEDIVLLTRVFHPAPRERGRVNVTRCVHTICFLLNIFWNYRAQMQGWIKSADLGKDTNKILLHWEFHDHSGWKKFGTTRNLPKWKVKKVWVSLQHCTYNIWIFPDKSLSSDVYSFQKKAAIL